MNKRTRKKQQKKQEEARYYRSRIEFVGWLAYVSRPGEPRTRQLSLAKMLWLCDDRTLLKAYESWVIRSSPLRRMIPRPEQPKIDWASTVGYRPSITDVRERVKE